MFLLPAYLAIHLALSVGSSSKILDLQVNLTHVNPPTDLKIVDGQFGDFNFSWNSNLTEDLLNGYKVKYVFEYRYHDKDRWENDGRLPTEEHESKFELHRGVSIRIRNVLLSEETVLRKSNWTEKMIRSPDLQGRQGCHIGKMVIEQDDLEEPLLICVNGSNNSTSISPYYVQINPQEFEKYNPPHNVKIFPNLTVTWDKPAGYNINDDCFGYQLQLTELDGNNIKVLHVKGETKRILNTNLAKRYSVKVRTKMEVCLETKYWSEWSVEAFIEPKELLNGRVVAIVLLMTAVMTILLMSLIFRRYKDFIFRQVPDPQKNFKELFEEYNGDFQKWLGYQIPTSKYEECSTVVIEERTRPEAQVKKCSFSITTDLFTAEDYRHSMCKAVDQIS
ncbi:interleukin-5 receptor subunit alpha-like isoform X2 [Mobula hypostoma]|uniref:interleukin-5 receptor subunit alpha-like isoform X2 n=1 Tax=Mobula hypostoma TaxID=723540 RepID=UPI002FC3299A